MRPIEYKDYDKISSDVLYLGSKLVLRINVSLSHKQEPDMRYHFHKEYGYDSPYSKNKLITMRLSYTYYLTLDKIDMRFGIMIRPQDMILLQRQLNKVILWFEDKSHNAFFVKDKKLIIKKQEPIILEGLANNKYLKFEPILLTSDQDNRQSPGVRITLGDEEVFADISVDQLYALVYTLKDFRMFECAQSLVNYLGRPEFGTSFREMENNLDPIPQRESSMEGAKLGRTIKTQQQQISFFDRINQMED